MQRVIGKLPGSGFFLGNLLRMKAENSSPRVTLARSLNFGFLERSPLRYLEYLGMWAIASRKRMLRWSFRSIYMKPPHSSSNLEYLAIMLFPLALAMKLTYSLRVLVSFIAWQSAIS
ncbi:unnamed protein product [Linum trigynum]|uniref:Uncharacterized protein n=1 Tax=Linum trigynum TaxID=586398 RepID=A0AAV2FQ01_9ROSI